jgi:hypothetical protein
MSGAQPQVTNEVVATLDGAAVDLGADLRRELAALAGRTRRLQVELIRDALALYIDLQGPPALPSWVGSAAVGGDAGKARRAQGDRSLRATDAKRSGSKRCS